MRHFSEAKKIGICSTHVFLVFRCSPVHLFFMANTLRVIEYAGRNVHIVSLTIKFLC